MKKMMWMLGVLVIGVNVCLADLVLFRDNFDYQGTNSLNYGIATRQTGTVAPVSYTNNATSPAYAVVTSNSNMRLYRGSSAGSIFAKLETDFSTVATAVRIAADIQHMNPTLSGFSMINFGLNATDTTANSAFSFRMQSSTATKTLKFYEATNVIATMDITSIYQATNSFVIDFTGGKTVSATLNGTVFDFGGGVTSYTGAVRANNYVQLAYYNGTTTLASITVDNLSVTSIPEPTTLSLFMVSCVGLFLTRHFTAK